MPTLTHEITDHCRQCGKTYTYTAPLFYQPEYGTALCPACADAAEAARLAADARRRAAEQFQANYAASGLDCAFMGFDANHPQANRELFHWARENSSGSMFITARPGWGKTRIVQQLALEEMKRKPTTVFFASAPNLCDMIAAAAQAERSRLGLIQRISRADLLIIDDLGKEAPTAARSSTMWQILDNRYSASCAHRAGHPTRWGWRLWVTSQLSSAELIARHSNADGASIIRRIIETCEIFSERKGTR